MYYNSSNSQVYYPSKTYNEYNHVKEIVSGLMIREIWEKIWLALWDYERINDNIIGYNENKYKEAEKMYIMTYAGVNHLAKHYTLAETALENICLLEDNWNGNGAQSFSQNLVEKCYKILVQLAAEPFICPTACGAIQFEYEKENGEYLEFEVYEEKIEAFSVSQEGEEKEKSLIGISAIDQMKQMVVDFYG